MNEHDGVAGWLVVTGDINEGFNIYGDFESSAAADKWAAKHFNRHEYVLATMQLPD